MAGNNPILGGGGFHHVAIKVRDFDRTIAMYETAFGFTEKVAWGSKEPTADKRAVMLDIGDGNYLEIFAGAEGPSPVPIGPMACGPVLIHWAMRTTHIAEVAARAKAAGFKVTVDPKEVAPVGVTARVAFCEGPDGEVFEFFEGEFFRT